MNSLNKLIYITILHINIIVTTHMRWLKGKWPSPPGPITYSVLEPLHEDHPDCVERTSRRQLFASTKDSKDCKHSRLSVAKSYENTDSVFIGYCDGTTLLYYDVRNANEPWVRFPAAGVAESTVPSYSVDEEWFFEYPEISNALFVAPKDTFNGFFSSVFFHQSNAYSNTQWYLLLKDAQEMSMEQLHPMLQSFKRSLQPNGGFFASNTHIIKYEVGGNIDPLSQKLRDLVDYGFLREGFVQ